MFLYKKANLQQFLKLRLKLVKMKQTAERFIEVMDPRKNGKEFRTSIGGQALIEGIMMRGPKKIAIVVRTKDELVSKVENLKLVKDKYPILGFVFIRGVVNFANSLSVGMRSLMYSAEQIPEEEQEEEEQSKFWKWLDKKLGSKTAERVFITFGVILGIALSIGLFIILPTLLAGLLSDFIENRIVRNLVEGLFRIVIFLSYMWFATRMNTMKRVWAYHGAEHKAIYCYEKGLPLTVENVKEQSRFHPRCGTSFLFIVMITSIFVFSFTSSDNVWIRVGLRLAFLPAVVAISYEIIRFAGRYDNLITAVISAPGKLLQKLTTREPDDEMIEVAIEAIVNVIPENAAEAKW